MNYVLIDASLALVALVVGFCSALWYTRNSKPSHGPTLGSDDLKQQEELANNAERANMAACQLRDLAKNVASDVGAHNSLVTNISNELDSMVGTPDQTDSAVAEAVAKILDANKKLQTRLAEAEKKIQAQAEEIRTQQSEAHTDALTNLANRRAFDEAMKRNIDHFNSHRKPFSLLIFDVDHFKQFNDTHGHQAGDEVLRCVGRTLASTSKGTDIPCRYGGEEFAIILPETRIDSARITAERVRKAIEEMAIDFEGKTLRVTASIGVAEMITGEDQSQIIRRSDDGVYAAKNAGRNQTFWHNGTETLPIQAAETTKPAIEVKKTAASKAQEGDLPNRETFAWELGRRISESHRFGVSLSVMQISILDFDSLEKEYGDAVGQLLLDSVAQFIRNCLRDMDLLGQLAQGDFVVMLPGSSENEARLVGNRIHKAISECVIPLGARQISLDVLHFVTDVYPDDDAESMLYRVGEKIINGKHTALVAKA